MSYEDAEFEEFLADTDTAGDYGLGADDGYGYGNRYRPLGAMVEPGLGCLAVTIWVTSTLIATMLMLAAAVWALAGGSPPLMLILLALTFTGFVVSFMKLAHRIASPPRSKLR